MNKHQLYLKKKMKWKIRMFHVKHSFFCYNSFNFKERLIILETRNYEIKRNAIYAGELGMFNVNDSFIGKSIRCYSSYNAQMFGYSNDLYRIKEGDYFIHDFHPLRSILFCLNENNFSNDLLYNSPGYPILNVTDIQLIEKKYDNENAIIIRYARNLSSLLTFYDFPEFLTYKDIRKF